MKLRAQGRLFTALVFIVAGHLGCRTSQQEKASLGPPSTTAGLTVTILGEGHYLNGTVLLLREDASLEKNAGIQTGDAAATVAFSNITKGKKIVLFVSRGKHGPAVSLLNISPGIPSAITLSPRIMGVVRGTVLDKRLDPVEGVRVTFEIKDIFPPASHSAPTRQIIGGGGGSSGGIARGEIRSYSTFTWSLTSDGRYSYTSTTDSRGNFSLRGIPNRKVSVTLSHGQETIRRTLTAKKEPTITLSGP